MKKVFVEDILNENKNLFVLFGELGFCLVMWDFDLFLCYSVLVFVVIGVVIIFVVLLLVEVKSEIENKEENFSFLEELSLFMEKLKDVYYDDDDG